jgi:hypothetical protein
MPFTRKGPLPGVEGGPPNSSSYPGIDLQVSIPNRAPGQAEFPGAHVVQFPARNIRPARPRRIDVRITATDCRSPIGRTRALKLTEHDFAWLLEAAQRLEARR